MADHDPGWGNGFLEDTMTDEPHSPSDEDEATNDQPQDLMAGYQAGRLHESARNGHGAAEGCSILTRLSLLLMAMPTPIPMNTIIEANDWTAQ